MCRLRFGLGSVHHAGGAPDVRRRTVPGSYQDLNGAVLSRLDVLCEVLVLFRGGRKREKHYVGVNVSGSTRNHQKFSPYWSIASFCYYYYYYSSVRHHFCFLINRFLRFCFLFLHVGLCKTKDFSAAAVFVAAGSHLLPAHSAQQPGFNDFLLAEKKIKKEARLTANGTTGTLSDGCRVPDALHLQHRRVRSWFILHSLPIFGSHVSKGSNLVQFHHKC